MAYLDTYSGNWTAAEANHLLRRASFGCSQDTLTEALELGLTGTISKLFEAQPMPEPPLKYELDGTERDEVYDPEVNYGETWVNAAPYPILPTQQATNKAIRARNRSLYAWTFIQMQESGISIREKLTLFWHNHFVSVNTNPHREFYYINTLRENALGNFKELTKKITIDPNMLVYLSGNQNTNSAPNENYARELLELFTLGKGAAVGNGDYTNYTEDDIVAIAKILTGWRVKSLLDPDTLTPFFSNFNHSKGSKTLSHRFNNAVIEENGADEYKDLIDVIFQQEECSKFIIRQIYKWFVNSEITDDIEVNVITPLAKILRDNDYEIAPALKVILASDHFFESTFCMIKNPIDLMLSVTKSLLFDGPSTTIKEQYDYALVLYSACFDLNQDIFHHPDVAGWKAYYQAPLFYKSWVNSFLLPKRLDYCRIIVTGGDLVIDDITYTIPPLIPVLTIVSKIENATDPNVLIRSLSNLLFNYEVSEEQITSLKEFLIPGLPDFEWTVEYSEYLADSTNITLVVAVDKKLRNLLSIMVQMSEFQIM
ncbi:DUF1800 family protein [Polaribacter sp. MED152]|uniref:DUF1800 domain-containing protein n=1 Tax=Polaribacter sp. MED152 TaxID=313598 RepID=UPI000068CCAF|nr:DUF1800 domain-containing protein [Polaribacter sp. MED152]EAQ42559.1 protein of unknown function (DUF1800) [Polaribacter sp. MED152]